MLKADQKVDCSADLKAVCWVYSMAGLSAALWERLMAAAKEYLSAAHSVWQKVDLWVFHSAGKKVASSAVRLAELTAVEKAGRSAAKRVACLVELMVA